LPRFLFLILQLQLETADLGVQRFSLTLKQELVPFDFLPGSGTHLSIPV
jgi:hypothetical protein